MSSPVAPLSISEPSLERLLSIQDVANLLGVVTKTIYRSIKAGKLPVVRVGRLIRIRPSDLAKFMTDNSA